MSIPISGEWREARLLWREDFENSLLVQEDGLILFGAPTFSNGIVLDGATQYANYSGPKKQNIFGAGILSLIVRFTPTFAYDDGNDHYFIDSAPNNRLRLIKTAASNLELRIGGTPIRFVVAPARARPFDVGLTPKACPLVAPHARLEEHLGQAVLDHPALLPRADGLVGDPKRDRGARRSDLEGLVGRRRGSNNLSGNHGSP